VENLLPDLGECGGGRVVEEEHGSVVYSFGGDRRYDTLWTEHRIARESRTSFVNRLQLSTQPSLIFYFSVFQSTKRVHCPVSFGCASMGIPSTRGLEGKQVTKTLLSFKYYHRHSKDNRTS